MGYAWMGGFESGRKIPPPRPPLRAGPRVRNGMGGRWMGGEGKGKGRERKKKMGREEVGKKKMKLEFIGPGENPNKRIGGGAAKKKGGKGY